MPNLRLHEVDLPRLEVGEHRHAPPEVEDLLLQSPRLADQAEHLLVRQNLLQVRDSVHQLGQVQGAAAVMVQNIEKSLEFFRCGEEVQALKDVVEGGYVNCCLDELDELD